MVPAWAAKTGKAERGHWADLTAFIMASTAEIQMVSMLVSVGMGTVSIRAELRRGSDAGVWSGELAISSSGKPKKTTSRLSDNAVGTWLTR